MRSTANARPRNTTNKDGDDDNSTPSSDDDDDDTKEYDKFCAFKAHQAELAFKARQIANAENEAKQLAAAAKEDAATEVHRTRKKSTRAPTPAAPAALAPRKKVTAHASPKVASPKRTATKQTSPKRKRTSTIETTSIDNEWNENYYAPLEGDVEYHTEEDWQAEWDDQEEEEPMPYAKPPNPQPSRSRSHSRKTIPRQERMPSRTRSLSPHRLHSLSPRRLVANARRISPQQAQRTMNKISKSRTQKSAEKLPAWYPDATDSDSPTAKFLSHVYDKYKTKAPIKQNELKDTIRTIISDDDDFCTIYHLFDLDYSTHKINSVKNIDLLSKKLKELNLLS